MKAPISFEKEAQMPLIPLSVGDIRWNRTGSWRYMRPRYEDKTPPCNAACPVGVDIVGMMNLVARGELERASRLLRQENPLAGVCGRACFHPCESRCNRREFDEAVAINLVERFVADYGMGGPAVKPKRKTGKKVAVVGSGPAGLSCAYFLAVMGHEVVIYEALPVPGGILRVGIPPYRLPKDVVEREIKAIEGVGVKIETNCRVGEDITLEDLRERYDALFLSPGVHKAKDLGLAGEDSEGVLSVLEFLKRVNMGEEVSLGERVLVIGGGNAAIDAARSALRLGAKEVRMVCLESRDEMPAFREEVEEAEEEGILIENGWGPRRFLTRRGRVSGVEFVRCLSVFDAEGRFSPSFDERKKHRVETEGVIVAIGEEADPSLKEVMRGISWQGDAISVSPTGATSLEGVFAGGDIASPLHNIAQAIGSGKRGAVAIDCYLRGEEAGEVLKRIRVGGDGAVSMIKYLHPEERERSPYVVTFSDLNPQYFEYAERVRKIKLLPFERKEGFEEVVFGIAEEMAMREAGRCFSCGVCNECGNCYLFCPDISVLRDKGRIARKIDYDYCKGCGICFVECPRYALTLEVEER